MNQANSYRYNNANICQQPQAPQSNAMLPVQPYPQYPQYPQYPTMTHSQYNFNMAAHSYQQFPNYYQQNYPMYAIQPPQQAFNPPSTPQHLFYPPPQPSHNQSGFRSNDCKAPGANFQKNSGPSNFRCDPCGRDFGNMKAYTVHLSTHEKCAFEGCSFQGSKKCVSTHFQLSHGEFSGNGYKIINVEGENFRVLMGTNADEVAQWRAERKKKFPSVTHIQQQKEMRQAMIAAGGLDRNQKKRKGSDRRIPLVPSTVPVSVAAEALVQTKGNNVCLDEDSKISVALPGDSQVESGLVAAAPPAVAALGLLTGYDSDSECDGSDGKDGNDGKGGDGGRESKRAKTEDTGDAGDAGSELKYNGEVPGDVQGGGKGEGVGKRGTPHPLEREEAATTTASAGPVIGGSKRPCIFFKKGVCRKGNKCKFEHVITIKASKSQCESGTDAGGVVVIEMGQEQGTTDVSASKMDINLANRSKEKKAPDTKNNKKKGDVGIPRPLGSDNMVGSLFSKLVEKDTYVDESKILQCIRYILVENFFCDEDYANL